MRTNIKILNYIIFMEFIEKTKYNKMRAHLFLQKIFDKVNKLQKFNSRSVPESLKAL